MQLAVDAEPSTPHARRAGFDDIPGTEHRRFVVTLRRADFRNAHDGAVAGAVLHQIADFECFVHHGVITLIRVPAMKQSDPRM